MHFNQFRDFMPKERDFDHMVWYAANGISFNKFVKHNHTCFSSATQEELDFINLLCKNIADGRLGITDMENCIEVRAYGVYFNENRKIIIFNQT